jgi:hypothetical protein
MTGVRTENYVALYNNTVQNMATRQDLWKGYEVCARTFLIEYLPA